MISLSDELTGLVKAADGKAMSVGQILDHLKDRGHALFIIVIIAPFLLLPTTFGLSAPMGTAVAIIGFCIMIGRTPWLPGFLLRKQFPYEALERVAGRAARMSARVEKLSRPRLGILLWPGIINFAGLELVIWGLLMAVPGPNNVFAFMITLVAFGLLMRDGLFLLTAHVLTMIAPLLVWLYWDWIAGIFGETWHFMQNMIGKFTALFGA